MRLFSNKKGAELSVNVIIIAILAILVLVVMAFIFTGGTSKITQTMSRILGQAPEANDISLAIAECNTRCSTAKNTNNDNYFCKHTVTYQGTQEDVKRIDKNCWDKTVEIGERVNCNIVCP
tara:strand:+ start:5551 stop:5913 length:363 start_codon:yes stop_codon:yes gene_type:complete